MHQYDGKTRKRRAESKMKKVHPLLAACCLSHIFPRQSSPSSSVCGEKKEGLTLGTKKKKSPDIPLSQVYSKNLRLRFHSALAGCLYVCRRSRTASSSVLRMSALPSRPSLLRPHLSSKKSNFLVGRPKLHAPGAVLRSCWPRFLLLWTLFGPWRRRHAASPPRECLVLSRTHRSTVPTEPDRSPHAKKHTQNTRHASIVARKNITCCTPSTLLLVLSPRHSCLPAPPPASDENQSACELAVRIIFVKECGSGRRERPPPVHSEDVAALRTPLLLLLLLPILAASCPARSSSLSRVHHIMPR